MTTTFAARANRSFNLLFYPIFFGGVGFLACRPLGFRGAVGFMALATAWFIFLRLLMGVTFGYALTTILRWPRPLILCSVVIDAIGMAAAWRVAPALVWSSLFAVALSELAFWLRPSERGEQEPR